MVKIIAAILLLSYSSCGQGIIADLSEKLDQVKVDIKRSVYIDPSFNLATVLTQLVPGERLVMTAGHYSVGSFSVLVSGAAIRPIEIIAQGKVDVNCQSRFLVRGSDVHIEGIEFYTYSWVGDRFMGAQNLDFSIEGPRTIIKNCVIHDFSNVGLWSNAPDSHFEGNLVYSIGYGNGSQGHSLYTQNAEGTIIIKNNIFLAGNFNSQYCLHLYGSGGARGLKGYLLSRNIFFGVGNMIGSPATKVYEINFNNNVMVRSSFSLGAGGWATEPLHEMNADGNRMWDSNFSVKKAGVLNMTNTRATFSSGTANGNITQVVAGNIDYNRYRFYGKDPYNLYNVNYVIGYGPYALQMIQKGTPFEAHSTDERYFDSVPPDEIDVNLYQTDRANVAIANYSLSNNVNVSFPGMDMGSYRAYNAQNPKEWFDFDFVGAAISFPMTGWTVSPPIGTAGGAMVQTSTMFPKFGIFYITKKP